MNSKHPTYPNPTIQEALCEIHFRLPEGVEWKATTFGEFFKAVQDEFPEMEPVSQMGFQLQAGPAGIEHTVLPPRQRMRYRHAKKNLLIQLSEGIFTVNVLPVYRGWQSMEQDILDSWNRALKTVGPAGVTRIGLRYIDYIQRDTPGERPIEWLKPSDYLPPAALSSLPGFLCRLEMRAEPDRRLVVTLGETEDPSPAIVLDIDCIVEKDVGIDDESIRREIARLHDMESDVFFASMTPRLERKLQGGQE